jgi:hypothetical protein
MKNILKIITLVVITLFVTASCQNDPTNWEQLTNKTDPNATYYLQFKEASKSLQTGVAADGSLVDIETTVTVALLGLPQSNDVVVNFTIDAGSTINASMYALSASSITIPAGATSGSVNLKTNTALMPTGQVLKLILNIDAGNNAATAGTKLEYDLERINFCLLTLADYVGTWKGTDSLGYPTEVTTAIDGDGDLVMNGIGFGWFQSYWDEVIITNTAVKVDINLITGAFVIDDSKQTSPYITSTYLGAAQPPYNMKASGKITSTCDRIIEFEYSFIQDGAAQDGVAWAGAKFKEIIQPN